MLVQLRVPGQKQVTDLPPPVVNPGGRLAVIMKATNICNIACTFCSVGPAGKDVMDWSDFEHLASELERTIHNWDLRQLELTFHGGEPTALGAEWIDRACRRIAELPVEVTFSMQTNLFSFPDRMIEVAKTHEIRIGSSIDPIFGERIDFRGQDTYARWVANYKKLSDAGFRIGAIFIVTKQAAGRAVELYRACEALNQYTDYPFGLQVQPVYASGRASDATELLLTREELGKFFVELYQTWEASNRSINLTPINTFADSFEPRYGAYGLQCAFGPGCATSHVGIDWALNVAGCGRRLDSDSTFGNLHEGHLDDIMLNSVEKRKLAQRTELLRNTECNSCRFFRICHGGCPDDAHLGYDDVSRKFYWCESYMRLYEAIEARAAGQCERPVLASAGAGDLGVSDVGNGASVSSGAGGAPDGTRGGAAGGMAGGDETAERPPARATTLVVASDRVSDLLVRPGEADRIERWILPTDDGAILELGSDLEAVLEDDPDLVRVWVHNRHARSLRVWQDFLRDPRVHVILFEAKNDLSIALNLLNALGATVILDLPSICAEEEGERAVLAALERYMTDPLWKIQVAPFAQMLRGGLDGVTAPWINRWGLMPGTFSCALPTSRIETLSVSARKLVEQLDREQQVDAASWFVEHRACGTCTVRHLCGGQLSAWGGQLCSPSELAVVRSVDAQVQAIRAKLSEIGEKNRAAAGPIDRS